MKVTAPGFSLDASGSLGGALVASKWKGRNYMRRLVTPANPRSDAQVSNRTMMGFLAQAWANLTGLQQAAWQELAAQGNYSPFNAYVKENQKRWTQWTYPHITPTQATGAAPVNLAGNDAAGEVGQISGTVTFGNPVAVVWGLIAYVNLTDDLVIARNDLKLGVYTTAPNAQTLNYVIPNLPPDTYYVKAAVLSIGGVTSALFKSAACVVT